ncbi:hypothetical protein [Dyadobacter diqingensis]|uniref:hypothetical protein n=1 Tax=Dyadobacter diqingensis TaxID=2938121 RepID=UPI0020C21AF0|nr:hypothetical protein [Dyadobacter diqingensis]
MKQFVLFFLTLLTAFISCKKTGTNPCEGLLNETQPTQIIVKFINKQTKETLLVDAAKIKITDKRSGNLIAGWSVYNRASESMLNGAISIPVFSESAGVYQYNMQLGDIGTAILSYQIDRKETDNPCRPFSYPVNDVKIVNQPFDYLEQNGKPNPRILVVSL